MCLVEAGPDYGPHSAGRWPTDLLSPRRRPISHDWGYAGVRPDGRTDSEPLAKVLGGCSVHNQCAAIWGPPEDYDAWAASGNPGWTHRELAPFVDQVERAIPATDAPFRGSHGILPTRPYADSELSAWQGLFLRAAISSGYPRLDDLSQPMPAEGVAPFHANVATGMRWNSAFAFLDPVRDSPGLTVRPETLADSFEVRQGRVLTIMGEARTGPIGLSGKIFVLCSGVYGSPAILLRSGIGPADHLEALGIPLAVSLPGVGNNLQDHPGIGLSFRAAPSTREALAEDVARNRLYQSQVILRARTRFAEDRFDLHVVPYQKEAETGDWSFDILAFNLSPRSRGRVRLAGVDPRLSPKIEFGYLTDPDGRDAAVLFDGVSLVRRIVRSEPLASAVTAETEPGPSMRDDRELRAYVEANVSGYAHPVGTCKMGPAADRTAVVEATGHVHRIENLFVADASIMPRIPRANTNLTCLLIGMRVAWVVARELARA